MTCAGATIGLHRGVDTVVSQRDYMASHWGWICGSDWPGMIVIHLAVGAVLGYAFARALRMTR